MTIYKAVRGPIFRGTSGYDSLNEYWTSRTPRWVENERERGQRKMRTLVVVVLVALAASGCTQIQLRRSTLSQARTQTDLQYQQVLDNLATVAAAPEALPWHLKLTGGDVAE